MSTTVTVTPARLAEYTVVDVRGPGEYAAGHLPGALSIPLDRVEEAADALRSAVAAGQALLLVCASGVRSAQARDRLAALGVTAVALEGGTQGWAAAGHPLERAAGAVRAPWPMDRQVRLAAGTLVLAGFLAGLAWPPAHWLSGLIGAGLVYSAVSGTCGMAAALARLPYNRRGAEGPALEETLARLKA